MSDSECAASNDDMLAVFADFQTEVVDSIGTANLRSWLGSANNEEWLKDPVWSEMIVAIDDNKSERLMELCEQCELETAEKFLRALEVAYAEHVTLKGLDRRLEAMVKALLPLCDRGWPSVNDEVKSIAGNLITASGQRVVRKYATQALRKLFLSADSKPWNDFFIILDSLDETQFHLFAPVIPRWNALSKACAPLNASESASFPWQWMLKLYQKAFQHSNGRVRFFTVRHFLNANPIHFADADSVTFLFETFLPILLTNDTLWRLENVSLLESFSVDLGNFILNILNVQKEEKKSSFCASLFGLFDRYAICCPLFFLSAALANLPATPIFASESFFIFRRAMRSIAHVQFKVLRICTQTNLLKAFVNLTDWPDFTSISFAPVVASEVPADGWLEHFCSYLPPSVSEKGLAAGKLSSESLLETYLQSTNDVDSWEEVVIASRIAWNLASRDSITDQFCRVVASEFERLSDSTTTDLRYSGGFWDINRFCQLYLESPFGFESHLNVHRLWSWFCWCVEVGCELLPGEITDAEDLEGIYTSVGMRRYCLQGAGALAKSLDLLDTPATSRGCALMARFILRATEIFRGAKQNTRSGIVLAVLKRLFYFCSSKRFSMKSNGMGSAGDEDFRAGVLRIYLDVNSYLVGMFSPAYPSFDTLITALSTASLWTRKRALLDAIGAVFAKVVSSVGAEQEEFKRAVQAAEEIVIDEEGSSNHYSAIEGMLRICFSRWEENCQMICIEKVSSFLLSVDSNPRLAFTILSEIADAGPSLHIGFAPILVRLAVFGPLPTRDSVVREATSAIAQDRTLTSLLWVSDSDQLHEVAKRVRCLTLKEIKKLVVDGNRLFSGALATSAMAFFRDVESTSTHTFYLSYGHRMKTRVMQLLYLLVPYLNKQSQSDVYNHCCDCLLDSAQQSSTKLFAECILSRIILNHEGLCGHFVESVREFAVKRIGSVSSWIDVLLHVATATKSKEHIERCMKLFLGWTTAQNFSVRCTAIAALRSLWNAADVEIRSSYGYIKDIIDFNMEPAGNAKHVIDNLCHDFYFAFYNCLVHTDLQTVLEIFPRSLGLPEDEVFSKDLLVELFDKSVLTSDREFETAPSVVYRGPVRDTLNPLDDAPASEADDFEDSFVQRKLNVIRGKWQPPEGTSLIVVASLLNKAANIGGLCRTCEIFGAAKLVVADTKILKEKDFTSLSMSSERLIAVEEVRVSSLGDYLRNLQKNGYVVVAAEQCTGSVALQNFRYPKKCVLLLGDEKEGIPMEFLRCVNSTVEISQYGETRSLNVHVTAALFIQRYAEKNYEEGSTLMEAFEL